MVLAAYQDPRRRVVTIPPCIPSANQSRRSLYSVLHEDYKKYLAVEQIKTFFEFIQFQFSLIYARGDFGTDFNLRFSRDTTLKNRMLSLKVCAPFFSGWFTKEPFSDILHLQIVSPLPKENGKIVGSGKCKNIKRSTSYCFFHDFIQQSFMLIKKTNTVLGVTKEYFSNPNNKISNVRNGFKNHALLVKIMPDRIVAFPKIYPTLTSSTFLKVEYEQDLYAADFREVCPSLCIPLNYEKTQAIPLSLKDLFKGITYVAESLKILHSHNYVHRDLYDCNVFVEASNPHCWKLLLADFDMMALKGGQGQKYDCTHWDSGSKEYGYITPFADIYALSCILGITLLKHQFLFFTHNRTEILTESFENTVFEMAKAEAEKLLPVNAKTFVELSKEVKKAIADRSMQDCKIIQLKRLLEDLHLIFGIKSLIVHIVRSDLELYETLEEIENLRMSPVPQDIIAADKLFVSIYETMPTAEEVFESCNSILESSARLN